MFAYLTATYLNYADQQDRQLVAAVTEHLPSLMVKKIIHVWHKYTKFAIVTDHKYADMFHMNYGKQYLVNGIKHREGGLPSGVYKWLSYMWTVCFEQYNNYTDGIAHLTYTQGKLKSYAKYKNGSVIESVEFEHGNYKVCKKGVTYRVTTDGLYTYLREDGYFSRKASQDLESPQLTYEYVRKEHLAVRQQFYDLLIVDAPEIFSSS